MQYSNYYAYNSRSCRSNNPAAKLLSALLAAAGGLCLAAVLLHTAETAASGWSPTETARRCFRYPEEPFIPERQLIGQMLLSRAFFGSDALYFDDGEENTGINDLSLPDRSHISGEETPENPIGDPGSTIDRNSNIYYFDRSILPDGQVALFPYDLSGSPSRGEILLSNTTGYSIDADRLTGNDYPIPVNLSEYSQTAPLVLIIHTHGTESYSPDGAVYCSPSAVQRDSDINNNVVSVGAVMADMLNEAGIPTLHCETMHDLESYTRAYDLAADTIQRYLSEYPSIKYVFDVHRDAIVRSNGDLVRPITVINGKRTAQIMLLVGTNEKGADHPSWETNFTVAAKLQSKLTSTYERFARPINIRGASFNEQFTPGSLLIEIGSAANSLSEAKNAAKYLTYSIIEMIYENAKK